MPKDPRITCCYCAWHILLIVLLPYDGALSESHSELPNQIGKNTALHLCPMVESIVPGQTVGAQLVKGGWSV